MSQDSSSTGLSIGLGRIYDIVGNIIPGLMTLLLVGLALPVGSLDRISLTFIQQSSFRGFIPSIIFVIAMYAIGQIAHPLTRFVPLRRSFSALFDAVPITPLPQTLFLKIDDGTKQQFDWACNLLFLDEDDPTTQTRNGEKVVINRVQREEKLAERYLLQKGLREINSYSSLASSFWTLESLFVLYSLFFASIIYMRYIFTSNSDFLALVVGVSLVLLALCILVQGAIDDITSLKAEAKNKWKNVFKGLGVILLVESIFTFFGTFAALHQSIRVSIHSIVSYESYIESIFGGGFHLLPLAILFFGYIFHYHTRRYHLKYKLSTKENLYPVAVAEGDIDPVDPEFGGDYNQPQTALDEE